MEKMKKITDAELKSGVQALADRPNFASKYGTGGLSAQDLKKHFDNLAVLLAKHYNDLCDALQGEEASKYIGLPELSDKVKGDLFSLVASFADGKFASEVLKLYPNATDKQLVSLQEVIFAILQALSDHKTENDNAADALEQEIADGTLSDKLKTGFKDGASDYTLRQALIHLYTNMVSKEDVYLEDLLGGESKVFAINKDGHRVMHRVSTIPYARSLVRRDDNGLISVDVTKESTSGHAINKGYVDGTFATKELVALCARTLYVDKNFVNSSELSLDPTNFKLTIRLLNKEGTEISSDVVDLPLESMVIDATCSGSTLTLKLQNEKTVDVDVSAIVSGLVPNIRTINGKKLENDITLGAQNFEDIYSKTEIDNAFVKSNEIKAKLVALVQEQLLKKDPQRKYTHLFGVDNKDNMVMQAIRVAAEPNSLAHRDEKGRLSGAAPESDKHLTNKKYVNEYVDEKAKALADRLTMAEEELATLAASGGGQPTVLLTEVEDTFTERETAGGLNVADGTVTEVEKITGATVAVMDPSYRYGGDIYASYSEIYITDEAAEAAGILASSSDEISNDGGYRLYDDFSVVTGNYSYQNAIPEGFYFYVQTGDFGSFGDGDVICRVGDAWKLVLSQLVSAHFEKIESTSADGKRQSELSLAEPVELGKWDTLDVESGEITRQTVTIDACQKEVSYAGTVSSGSVNYVSFTFSDSAINVYEGRFATTDVVSNYYETGSVWGGDKRIALGRTAQNYPLFNIRDDELCVFNDDGTLDKDATIAAFKAHIVDLGLVIVYKPSVVQSTESIDCPTGYVAYNGGTERVVQGDVDNSAYGAECTVTQTYYVSYGGDA